MLSPGVPNISGSAKSTNCSSSSVTEATTLDCCRMRVAAARGDGGHGDMPAASGGLQDPACASSRPSASSNSPTSSAADGRGTSGAGGRFLTRFGLRAAARAAGAAAACAAGAPTTAALAAGAPIAAA
eukprot:scaffold3082_cov119-Isochrysis_galbana.AAC.7